MLRRLFNSLYDKLLSRLGLALLALALFVNIGALIAVDDGVAELDGAQKRAAHAVLVISETLGIQSMLYEAESAQRGYLYTDSAEYLKPLSEQLISARLLKLREMVTSDPKQRKLVDRVANIAQEKIADVNKTIAIQQMGQKEAARELVMTDLGRQLMVSLDKELTNFLAEEEKLRQERAGKYHDIQLATRWGFAAILFINALMILTAAMTIMRDMSQKRAELARLDERATVLASEVAQRAEELRALSAHLLRVQEEERRTIARELHDELGGTLSAVKMDILMGRDAASKRSDEKSVARLQRALASIDSGIVFIRRLIEDLRPTLLDNLGLEAALRSMIDQFQERTNVECTISLPDGELNLTSAQSTAVYRICQEALTNIMKYAKAKSVALTLTSDGAQWKLLLSDDGIGLEATKQHRAISHGLLGMRERIVALGGTFDIHGSAGHGTTLNATFPVTANEEPAV